VSRTQTGFPQGSNSIVSYVQNWYPDHRTMECGMK